MKEDKFSLQGCWVALVTPMHTSGDVDYESFGSLIDWHIASGTSGLVINGTTAEVATLTGAEKVRLLEIAVERAAGKIPIIAGTGSNATSATIQDTKIAADLGVYACMIVTPYYNLPTQTGLYEHYKSVATAVNCPIVLYNVPKRTGCDLLPATVAELAKLPQIVGIKEASPQQVSRISILRNLVNKPFALLSGDDNLAGDFIINGGDGLISVAANIVPQKMLQVYQASVAGDAATVSKINRSLVNLYEILSMEPNPIPIKFLLHNIGKINAGIRLPLTWLASCHQNQIPAYWQQSLVELESL